MYHYVRPDDDRPPSGYYRLDRADFRSQLDHFERRYDVLDGDDARAVLDGERPPSDDDLLLTFDDGLADHHEWVLPELRSRGLCGLFFVSTGPLDGRALAVHRVHALLGSHPSDAVHDALRDAMAARGVARDAEGATDTYGEGGASGEAADAAATVKRLVNFEVPPEAVDGVLDAVEERLSAPSIDPGAFYLSETRLRSLDEAGMLLGAHSVTHPVLSRLPEAAQRAEIRGSFDRLEAVVGPLDRRLFAYPYGGPATFDETTTELLRAAACDAAFTTVSGSVRRDDLVSRPLELPRRDCNEFPHGDASFDM